MLSQVKTFEYVCCRLHGDISGDVVVASIYRPGSAAVTPIFFAELTTFLEALATYRCPIVLLSDFNVHLEKVGNADADGLKSLLASFDMCQHVQDATHTAGGCLDLVITQSEVKVTHLLVSNIGFSYHCLVTCQLLVIFPEVDPFQLKVVNGRGFRWRV